METKSTFKQMPEDYEISGIGSAPEEDGLVVTSDEAIRKLRKPGFFRKLFSGPYELSGVGANSDEGDLVIQEIVERGIWR